MDGQTTLVNWSHKVATRFSLVNTLLNYPHQANNILQENQEIIDYALVQLLETMSDYMERHNRQGAANFLRDIAGMIQGDLRTRELIN
jgi:hypothetical protein